MQQLAILDLKGPQDWEARPAFKAVHHATSDDLDHIAGRYDLPRPKAGEHPRRGMVHCGLNACNEQHFRGFLVRFKDGAETIVGRDCGREKMGAIFEEIEATFVAQENLQSRLKVLADLSVAKTALIAQASDLLPKCRAATTSVAAVVKDLAGHSAMWRKLNDIARQGGRILVEAEISDMQERGASVDLVEVSRINECQLIFEDFSVHTRALQHQVIHWLSFELDTQITEAGEDMKKLDALSKKAAGMNDTLNNAEAFLKRSAILLTPGNLSGLEIIAQKLLSKSQRSGSLFRAINRVAI